MICIYQVRTDTITGEEGEAVKVYGISAIDPDTLKAKDSIPDVFFDKEKAEAFVALCNSLKLDLIHLRDVVEDQLV